MPVPFRLDRIFPGRIAPFRIAAVDLARSAALLGMVMFHFTFDLELFGYLPAGTTGWPGFWAVWARTVAGSFLFLAGVSLYLAHGNGIRWPAFWRRLAMVAGAAALVSLGTYLAVPEQYVFFGILHAIAAYSLLGLIFLRWPPLAIVLAVLVLWIGRDHLTSEFFQHPGLYWTGLAPLPPLTADFEPMFPWFGTFLLGLATASASARSGLTTRIAKWPARVGRWLDRLTWPGRHSLAIYLIHQPVLLTLVWAFTSLRS